VTDRIEINESEKCHEKHIEHGGAAAWRSSEKRHVKKKNQRRK